MLYNFISCKTRHRTKGILIVREVNIQVSMKPSSSIAKLTLSAITVAFVALHIANAEKCGLCGSNHCMCIGTVTTPDGTTTTGVWRCQRRGASANCGSKNVASGSGAASASGSNSISMAASDEEQQEKSCGFCSEGECLCFTEADLSFENSTNEGALASTPTNSSQLGLAF